ncbi:MAG: nucleoside deaminase [Propionibacteriaceae bacterium]
MALALDEGRLAAAHGDVPIGAVVLAPDGTILARGHNERELSGDPLAHAEIVALRRAAAARGSWRFDDCALVVTLEPCVMCAGAISQSRVGTLVFGAFDDKAGAVASVFDVVRDERLPHRVDVVSGFQAEPCAALLQDFFAQRR